MLHLEDWMDVHLLHKQGHSQREIARLTGHGRNTVSKMLKMPASAAHTRTYKARPSKLDPYKDYIRDRYTQCGLSGIRVFAEIQPMSYTGSIDLVQRFIQTLAPYTRAVTKATVRYETAPGEQAQADWAYCGRFTDPQGTVVPIYAFVIVLGFSRLLFVEFTTDMTLDTLIRCHQHAFAFFGGCPKTILYDNMKQVKLAPGEFNPLFVDFAQHYGFVPKTHRVRRPRTKGKVERMVYYVKDNFLTGRSFIDLADLNTHARQWLDQTANVRRHATTNQRPVDLWASEKPLLAAPPVAYTLTQHDVRKVSTESFVHLHGSRYSVPPDYVGQPVIVEIRQGQQRVVIRAKNVIIADHPKATKRGESITDKAHLDALWKLSLSHDPPPSAGWQLTFSDSVAARPLSTYEAVLA